MRSETMVHFQLGEDDPNKVSGKGQERLRIKVNLSQIYMQLWCFPNYFCNIYNHSDSSHHTRLYSAV